MNVILAFPRRTNYSKCTRGVVRNVVKYYKFVFPQNNPTCIGLTHWGLVHMASDILVNISSGNVFVTCQVASHCLNQCWLVDSWTLMSKHMWNLNQSTNIFTLKNAFENVFSGHFVCSRPQCVNTSRLRQNGCQFADGTFKCIFLNKNVLISIEMSLNFVPKGPINNIPALVQILALCWPVDKPLSESLIVRLLMHIFVTQPQWVNLVAGVTLD